MVLQSLPFTLIIFGELAGGPIEDHMESFPSTPSIDFVSESQPSGSVGQSWAQHTIAGVTKGNMRRK